MRLDAIINADRRREEGAWMDSQSIPGLKLKVRGLGCTAHQAAVKEFWDNATDDHKKQPDIGDQAQRHMVRKALLVGWSLEDEFSEANVAAATKAKLFRDEVIELSSQVAATGRDEIEAEKGN